MDELHNYSDEALLAEVARRLAVRASTSQADGMPPTAMTHRVGLPAFKVPSGLADLQHDSDAIRRLLKVNRQRPGLRRCEIGEAFRTAGRPALNIDQKVQYLIGRNELVREIGQDGRTYWCLAATG